MPLQTVSNIINGKHEFREPARPAVLGVRLDLRSGGDGAEGAGALTCPAVLALNLEERGHERQTLGGQLAHPRQLRLRLPLCRASNRHFQVRKPVRKSFSSTNTC